METFGWVCFGIIVFVILCAIFNKVFDEEEKKESRTKEEIELKAIAKDMASDIIQQKQEVERAVHEMSEFLAAYGCYDEEVLLSLCNFVCSLPADFSDPSQYMEELASFLKENISQEPPDRDTFLEAVNLNYILIQQELEFNWDINLSLKFREILDKCDAVHINAFFNINKHLNCSGMVPYGVTSLNYYMFAYHFFVQAMDRTPSFEITISHEMFEKVTRLGHSHLVLDDDHTMYDALKWGDVLWSVLNLDISFEESNNVSFLLDEAAKLLQEETIEKSKQGDVIATLQLRFGGGRHRRHYY